MKRHRALYLGTLCSAALLIGSSIFAANVEPGIGYSNAFTAQPSAADWATFGRSGGGGDSYDPDADINSSITAAGVTSQAVQDSGNPAAQNTSATWSSTGQYLQTRPTGNRYTVLMGKFVNNTGTNATRVALSYLFTIVGGSTAEDSGKGTRAYYSVGGQAGSWVNLPSFNMVSSASTSVTMSTNLSINWSNGASLYVLWMDDNGNTGTDLANQYDNFSLQVTEGTPLTLACVVQSPAQNALFVAGSPVTATAAVYNGTAPYTVQFWTNSGAGNTEFKKAGSVADAPYTWNLGAPAAGTYNIYAVVYDEDGGIQNSATNTFSVANPISAALTSPADNASIDTAVNVEAAVAISGGTPPYTVQYYVDGAAKGAPVTTAPYATSLGNLFVGDHAIRATVSDSRGWSSNSAAHTVHITGALGVAMSPTNGATFPFGQPVILTATAGGGTAPYGLLFYVNDQPIGTRNASLTADLGVLQVGSYTSYVHAVDSTTPAPQQAYSSTNVFTILPNNLTVSITSPANGANAATNTGITLMAAAAVTAPVTVTKVDFYLDGTLVGSDATAPYSTPVSNPVLGAHSVYAVATDSLGRTSLSATNAVNFVLDPLANNNFANRITLSGAVVRTTGANAGANTETGEPTGSGFSRFGASLWWTWTAPVSATVQIDTIGSSFNTYLAVYTGSAVNALTQVAANDNATGMANVSLVTFAAVKDTQYQIQVSGVQGFGPGATIATGNIQLNLMVPPSVTLTAPTNNSVVIAADGFTATATASSPNGTIEQVSFFLGPQLMGIDTEAPYTASVTSATAGSNKVFAVARDSAGVVVTSAVANVLIANSGITLTTPQDGAIFQNANSIPVSAFAMPPAGVITNVDFYVDGQWFANSTGATFRVNWTNVTGGSHRFSAVARASTGNLYSSQPVYIGVAYPFVPWSTVWKYLDNGTDQGSAWIAPGFNDSAWASGPAELGYGDSDEATVVADNATPGYTSSDSDRYITTYFRRSFVADDLSNIESLQLTVEYDDAVVVYLNGAEVYRTENLPAAPEVVTYTTVATGNGLEDTTVTQTISLANLVRGTNVIAVEVHQQSASSSDLSFNSSLMGVPRIVRNSYPSVALTQPAQGAYFLAPAQLALAANAADADGSVTKVEFYVDGLKVGEDVESPYTLAWATPPMGAHVLHAVAYDDQGGVTTSDLIGVVVYDAQGTPVAKIISPVEGFTVEGPTNVVFTATANATGTLSEVRFTADGKTIGTSLTAPYGVLWTNVPFGAHAVVAIACDTAGVCGQSEPLNVTITIPPTNTIAPSIASVVPTAWTTVTNLTTIQVTFSERVVGVNASDLLVNGVAATSVVGSGSNYVFTVVQPAYGQVEIHWAAEHGIVDVGWPAPLPFNEADGAWGYTLKDRTPPTVTGRVPVASATLTNLTQITVTFSEPVSGVDASDLLVNGLPAYEVDGIGATYSFSVSQPASGSVSISWATNHGIVDLAPEPNAFNRLSVGATWNYTLDAKTILIQSNSYWLFVKGTNEPSAPATAWRERGFDATSWSNAPAPFFYGDPYSNGVPAFTLLSDMRSNYTSIYLRKEFVVPNATHLTNLYLRGQIDDGMIVWINGVEVLRTNVAAGEIPYSGTAAGFTVNEQSGVPTVNYTLLDPRSYLVSGTNVIAIHALNESLTTSSDFGFNAQLYTYQTDTEAAAPHIVRVEPAAGYVYALTNITVVFSEPVANVNASDLLINGVPATTLTSATNTVYTFGFAQPAYGSASITWASGHGIVDLDIDAKPFSAALPSSSWGYIILNPDAPYLIAATPAPQSTVTTLTQIAVVFSEPVTGVDAGDLLVNGVPALGLSGTGTNYVFGFTQPAYGAVSVSWATNHGIKDLSQGAVAFDLLWPNHSWTYTLVDQIAPSVALQNPPAGQIVTNLTQVTVVFSEAVSGVNATDLLINGKPASGMSGTNDTYTFTFAQPNASVIQISWAAAHGIRDLAVTPNTFDAAAASANWMYPTLDNVAPVLASVVPGPSTSLRGLRQISVSFDEPVQGVTANNLTVNGVAAQQLVGQGAGPYKFLFDQPATGSVQVALSGAISDMAIAANLFRGSNWTYVLNTNLAPPAITRGPYLQIGTPTSMVVRWRTGAATDSRVRYGLSASEMTSVIEDETVTTEHIVTVTNLTPSTRYYYAIGDSNGDLFRNDEDCYFSTFPTNPVPTRIWWISDYGLNNTDEQSVRNSYYEHVAPVKPANVWITGGDNDQVNGADSSYQNSVFGTNNGYGKLMRNLPMFPTIGNHDYQTSQGANYYANFSLPSRGEAGGVPSGTEHYYSFNYGDVHFINLDSIDGTLSRSNGTAMLQWLREDLEATTQRWIIAYWHGPPYTKGSHDSDSTTDTLAWMVQMREVVLPVLEAYGVDLVLCGHSHVYERSWPLFGHYGFSTSFNETNKIRLGDGKLDGTGAYRQSESGLGTVYITAGISGQPRNLTEEQHPAHLLKKTGILGSLVIDVDGDRLDLQYLNTSGVAEDYFTLMKGSDTTSKLAIWHSAGSATVAWPASAGGYQLQMSTGIGAAASWQTISNNIGTNGLYKTFNFDPRTNAPGGFFRLEKR